MQTTKQADGQRGLMRPRLLIGSLVLVPLLAVAGWAAVEYWPHDPPPPLAAPRNPVLPDLVMAPLADILAAETRDGSTQQIFFSASVANRGPGPFIINAVRGDEHGAWRVSQRFLDTGGATTETATPADMTWGGHGHNHWHVRIGAAYALYTVPGGVRVRSLEKVGYCFFDQKRYDRNAPNAPLHPVFPKDGCDGKPKLALDMGLSPGWQDPYTWVLPDQRLDITGLKDGRYRLVATADPHNWFREASENNNQAWVVLDVTTSVSSPTVAVVASGTNATDP